MIIVVLAIFGLIFGSFVNAWVWRLHELESLRGRTGKAATKKRRDLSIAMGRSMCPHCGHELAAKDLVPVLSWLLLGGRCRYCRRAISWQYPLVEMLTAALFVVSYLAWPLGYHGVGLFELVIWLGFVVAFMALAVYDLRWFLLPNRIVFPLIGLAIAEWLAVALWRHDLTALWQPAAGTVLIAGLFWVLFQVSGGAWIGGGDVKLAIVLGLLAATPVRAFLVIFFSSLIGTLVSIPLLLRTKKGLKMQIPFGPYLLLATAVIVLYGDRIVQWYQNVLLR